MSSATVETRSEPQRRANAGLSLRTRLLLLVFSIILPAGTAATWMSYEAIERERSALRQRLQETTRALAQVVDRELGKRALIARLLAESPYLDDAPTLSEDDLRDFHRQAVRAIDGPDGWVVLSSPAAQVLNTAFPFGQAPQPVMPTGARPFAVDAPQLVPLRTGRMTGRLLASYQEPVKRNGKTVLNVGVVVQPKEMQRIVDAQNVPSEWTIAIIDSNGTLVARRPQRFVGEQATADLRAALQARDEGYLASMTLEGRKTITFFSKSANYGWAFVIGVPRDQAGASFARQAALPLAVMGLVLLFALISAVWVWRGLARPVEALRNSAGRLGRGLAVQSNRTGVAEIDEVQAALEEASGKILSARAQLEREVASAVAKTEQAQQRLSQSQRIEALGRLTGGVAHDFNNLLAVIGANVHMLRRAPPGRDVKPQLDAIGRSVKTGSRLTEHLLRFARRQPVRPEVIDLASYLARIEEVLRTLVGSNVAMRMKIAADAAPIEVDVAELEIAIINLVSNAKDAMPAGGDLVIGVRNADARETSDLAAGAYVAIEVADSGSGIADEIAGKVFEPFFTTKDQGKGTGLGLSQVHGFCSQIGGSAQVVRPRDGSQGAVVRMLIPASKTPAGPPPPAPATVRLSVDAKRLLLVEDNAALAEATQVLLEDWGFRVTPVASADAALERLAAGDRFDVVLSDIVMPGTKSGLDLARELRGRRDAPPIVLTSGYTSAIDEAEELGVLQKPCPPEALFEALRRAMLSETEQPA